MASSPSPEGRQYTECSCFPGTTYVCSQPCEATLPLLDVKELLAEPAVSIVVTAAPERLADVIVQMDNHALTGKLFCNSVPNLEPGGILSEIGVLLEDLIEHLGTVCLAKSVDEALFECLIGAVGQIVVDHLDGKRQANRVQSKLWEPRDDIFDR